MLRRTVEIRKEKKSDLSYSSLTSIAAWRAGLSIELMSGIPGKQCLTIARIRPSAAGWYPATQPIAESSPALPRRWELPNAKREPRPRAALTSGRLASGPIRRAWHGRSLLLFHWDDVPAIRTAAPISARCEHLFRDNWQSPSTRSEVRIAQERCAKPFHPPEHYIHTRCKPDTLQEQWTTFSIFRACLLHRKEWLRCFMSLIADRRSDF
jgi:hypothetical protein